jgi:nitrogen fixation protein FixH
MNTPTIRRFNPWPWLPVFIIGAAAIANVAIIMVANRVSPQKVEDQAYAASARFDTDKAEAEAFAAKGYRLLVTAPDPMSLRLSIAGTASGAGEVRLYRPDAPSADHAVLWSDVAQPLILPLARQGLWRIDLRLIGSDGERLTAKAAIDTLTGYAP